MANQSLFNTLWAKLPGVTAQNEAGGKAYALSAAEMLAQFAATGCLNGTYYASAESQLNDVLMAAIDVAGDDPAFVAQCAVYMRKKMHMKDMPALLVALLTVEHGDIAEQIFDVVIDNGKMLRNFVQIMRSGAVPRKSLGSRPKRMVKRWLNTRSPGELFRQSVGQKPSMKDIIRMVHPKPKTAGHEAFYGYLLGKRVDVQCLPDEVQAFEAYKAGRTKVLPNVPFRMVTALDLGRAEWTRIAENAPWQMTRMNLNTFARHGVFESRRVTQIVARRLADPREIKRARVFPYQLLAAYVTAGDRLPLTVKRALEDAMEIAVDNVPVFSGKVAVCVDVSGSMHSPVTGYRRGATTMVRCIDAAALFAAAIVRKNPRALVVPFHDRVSDQAGKGRLVRGPVMDVARRLAALPSGGTNCSAPVKWLRAQGHDVDTVVMVSDNESWVDADVGRGTALMKAWRALSKGKRNAKLICIDMQPYGTVQAASGRDVLNVGGFSDEVFNVVGRFVQSDGATRWTDVIRTSPAG